MSTTPLPSPAYRRSRWRYALYGVAVVVTFIVLIIGGLAWYASTPNFQSRVRKIVIAELEKATGGRVELQGFAEDYRAGVKAKIAVLRKGRRR